MIAAASEPFRVVPRPSGSFRRLLRPAAQVWLHCVASPEACDRLPGFAFSHALALREMAAAKEPLPAAFAAALGDASVPPWADSGAAQLRGALLTFPQMLPAALQACAASSADCH